MFPVHTVFRTIAIETTRKLDRGLELSFAVSVFRHAQPGSCPVACPARRLAERVLPRAADLWVQASLEQRQRFQQLFFPDGIAFDGKGFVGTHVTAPAFSYLRTIEDRNERMVDQTGASWNRMAGWLRLLVAIDGHPGVD